MPDTIFVTWSHYRYGILQYAYATWSFPIWKHDTVHTVFLINKLLCNVGHLSDIQVCICRSIGKCYVSIIIHLRLNNVQQSMGKPGTQAQLIKTRILYSRSHEKSVLVLLVTREIRIMYSKSRALQQIYVRDFLD